MSEKAPIEITVEHQQDKQRFVIPVDGHEAILEYRLNGQHIDFNRTFVPDELRGIVKCANPKCITNNEPMPTRFHVIDKERCVIKCHYCEKEQTREEIEII